MAVQNVNAVKYAELTDEHIKDVKKGIEMFIESNEYWDKFAHHSSVPRGHKVFTSSRLVAPKIKKEQISPRAEFKAPRPTKIVVATFEKTVANYGDKAIYSREDMQYHFDNTVANIRATLQEVARQKLDLIKGEPFFKSKATITYSTSIINTAQNAAIILRKNKAQRWDGVHYLAHITPEALKQLRGEIAALGDRLSEPVKKELDGRTYDVYSYGDFMYSVTTSDLMYDTGTSGHQWIVFMGKRGIDGASPVDVAKLEGESGIEVINNGLGSGVLEDEDGNYTSDDNKQQGSVAINMDGLGACVSDDLCILDCDITLAEVKESPVALGEMSGFVSRSGNNILITESAGTKTHFSYDKGVFIDTSDSNKAYAAGSTVISVQVLADEGEAFSGGAAPTSSNWTATYTLTSGGDSINAEILAVVKTAVNYDTLVVRVPERCYSFTIASSATAD